MFEPAGSYVVACRAEGNAQSARKGSASIVTTRYVRPISMSTVWSMKPARSSFRRECRHYHAAAVTSRHRHVVIEPLQRLLPR
jgi:hypothetical protein